MSCLSFISPHSTISCPNVDLLWAVGEGTPILVTKMKACCSKQEAFVTRNTLPPLPELEIVVEQKKSKQADNVTSKGKIHLKEIHILNLVPCILLCLSGFG